jgi:hypothetical protein
MKTAFVQIQQRKKRLEEEKWRSAWRYWARETFEMGPARAKG